jgi:hypothetical protein
MNELAVTFLYIYIKVGVYIFCLDVCRRPDGEHFGEILFGGVFERYYTGNFTYVPLTDSTTWNFKLDS